MIFSNSSEIFSSTSCAINPIFFLHITNSFSLIILNVLGSIYLMILLKLLSIFLISYFNFVSECAKTVAVNSLPFAISAS